ncbi:Cinnamyl alcohol dehydrogenase 8 [Pleodorina starrii]|uniref:Cinnamyl alcohol dehydrogenase 8 n=1 Tax=Pleodorina starrii TaxID=330485 RepID=A0A9W6BES1_9CHLO|nr:Cinnamyl alcohol dehydrogenase 8 [Pleodorina starrii]GLC50807.1 Cinnamyl alcohol dehydrogenase 8 [Pleodorina starrii]GLC73999.1 Cinnamyl alcohol dehydrogenase 8 [Pleodorina starrii]
MPRIHSPSSAEIKAHPREFALLRQVAPSGETNAEALQEYVKLYGEPSKAVADGEISFADFAGMFSKPATARSDPPTNCIGYAARDKTGVLSPFTFDRRPVGPKDVRIQITHAGICHSDLHQIKDEWGGSLFPMVPGHEIVGIVTEVGSEVTSFKPGDRAGVGCMVDSCGACDMCKAPRCEEQFCSKCVYTYNCMQPDGTIAQGGYSSHIVVTEKFVLRLPENLPLEVTAPLLCAGITVYSPMKHFGLDKPGMKLGVVGLGGLGHMAVKIAKGMGLHVTVISTSESKKEEALNVLKADEFLVSKDEAAVKAAFGSLHGIIDTVSAQHDLAPLVGLLQVDGKLVLVGVPDKPLQLPNAAIVFKRATVGGSLIGGIRQTQEMLDFCGQHGIGASIEKIPIDYVNTAYERMLRSDVRYRFVIDIQGSLIN